MKRRKRRQKRQANAYLARDLVLPQSTNPRNEATYLIKSPLNNTLMGLFEYVIIVVIVIISTSSSSSDY